MAARFQFKRVKEAFDEMARARICTIQGVLLGCNGSSNDDDSLELSDLVDSYNYQDYDDEDDKSSTNAEENDDTSCGGWLVPDTKDMLRDLLGSCSSNVGGNNVVVVADDVKVKIRAEVELAYEMSIGMGSKDQHDGGFKRRLVDQLRERGFDSGICKSHWEKKSRFPAGEYEYVDVIVAGTRYIVEISLASEFSIARPTNRYLALLNEFPEIFVGKPEELKQVVMLMCAAAKESLLSRDMYVPPWRRNRYMEAKWFSPYERSTTSDAVSTEVRKISHSGAGLTVKPQERILQACSALSPLTLHFSCGGEFSGKVGLRVGKLAQAFNEA